ncbi:MAG: hypothetical protein JWM59_124 [Verrucomicrobiales bacterium]|nr:hypothetical protein [Verrucomicrobiales bacterium]
MPASAPLVLSCRAVCAMAALLVTSVAAVALDTLAPGEGPLVEPLSFLAHTDYAWLWHLTVGAGAAGLLLLAWTLRRRAASPVFTIALTVAGLGLMPVVVFPADLWLPWERPPTLSGGLHVGAVGLFILALSVAVTIRPRSLPMRGAWQWCRVAEVAYWGAVLGGAAYLGAVILAGRPPHLIGLWQRLVLGSAWAWSILLAAGGLRLKDR